MAFLATQLLSMNHLMHSSIAWLEWAGSIHVRYKNQTIKNRKLFEKERMRKDLLQNSTPHTFRGVDNCK